MVDGKFCRRLIPAALSPASPSGSAAASRGAGAVPYTHLRRAETGGQYPVVGTWLAAALDMPRNRDADFLPGLFRDLSSQLVGNRRIYHLILLLFFQLFLAQPRVLLGDGAFRHGQDGETFALLRPLLRCV